MYGWHLFVYKQKGIAGFIFKSRIFWIINLWNLKILNGEKKMKIYFGHLFRNKWKKQEENKNRIDFSNSVCMFYVWDETTLVRVCVCHHWQPFNIGQHNTVYEIYSSYSCMYAIHVFLDFSCNFEMTIFKHSWYVRCPHSILITIETLETFTTIYTAAKSSAYQQLSK